MSSRRAHGESTEEFWRTLAEKAGVQLVVFVASTDRTRTLWIADHEQALEADALFAAGRAGLAAVGATTFDSDLPGLTQETAAVPVCGQGGEISGVLLASKDHGSRWSPAERAVLEFAAELFADSLVARGSHPRPTHDLPPTRPRDGRESELETWMRGAPERGELYLVFQPEVELSTGAIVAVEALLRWDHPRRGPLDPDTFISIAEQSDLISVLGTWVLEEALREFAAWQPELTDSTLVLRVNVSPVQLADDGIVEQFADALARHGVRGDQLCVEITENVHDDAADDLARTVRALKDLGISSAIDDLATGYSTLARLRVLPVDTVKIDRSLVSGVDADTRARSIVAALIALCTELGVEVVAEGVETSAEAATLLELGCNRGQGHLFARPMAAEQLVKRLRTDRTDPPPGG